MAGRNATCRLSGKRYWREGFGWILPDLRGHGQSDKPLDPACYNNSRPWAEDMQKIIQTLDLKSPLMVGWSMGGWVVMDYLEHFGDAALAGVGLIGSSITTGRHLPPSAAQVRNDPSGSSLRGCILTIWLENSGGGASPSLMSVFIKSLRLR